MSSTFVQVRRTHFKRGLRFSVFDPIGDTVVATFRTRDEADDYVEAHPELTRYATSHGVPSLEMLEPVEWT